ncbi:MAG: hypothetical protein ACREIP_22120, partial [Alphaproteobacteria bacterium]
NLYRATEIAAERHLMAALETADGPLPEAASYYSERFGGLPYRGEAPRSGAVPASNTPTPRGARRAEI